MGGRWSGSPGAPRSAQREPASLPQAFFPRGCFFGRSVAFAIQAAKARRGIVDPVGEDLGQLVRVDLLDRLAHALELAGARLDEEEQLAVVADAPLPAVDRVDVRDDVDARRLAVADQRVGDVERLVLRPDRGDDDDEILRCHAARIPLRAAGWCQATEPARGIPPAPGVSIRSDL